MSLTGSLGGSRITFEYNQNMKKPVLCCRTFEGTTKSPFAKIIVLGYYDGETSGLVQCSNCPTAYRFELVAWDSNQESSIYSLAEIDSKVFDSIIKTLSFREEPQWPSWIPRWQFESSEREKLVREALDRDLEKASAPKLLIATDNIGKEVLACQEITSDATTHLPKPGVLPDASLWQYWQSKLA